MTADRLRDLLRERVEDLTTVDLTGDAWSDAQRIRRRRTAGVVAAAAACVAAIVGGAVLVGGGADDPAPAPPPAEQERSAEHRAQGQALERGADYREAVVWWGPTVAEEAELPRLDGTALPATIDLSGDLRPVPEGTRVVGAFQVWADTPADRVVLLADDGSSYSLDVGRLDPVVDEGGNSYPPLGATSVSPDGRFVFLRQEASLEVYDLARGAWTSIAVPRWTAEFAGWDDGGAIAVPDLDNPRRGWMRFSPTGERLGSSPSSGAPQADLPTDWARDEPYGPVRAGERGTAVAAWLAGPVAGPDRTGYRTVDSVVVSSGDEITVLAMPPGPGGERSKQCCSVVGWYDGAVLLLSRHERARILAWRPDSGELYRVASVRGWTFGEQSWIASFADDVGERSDG